MEDRGEYSMGFGDRLTGWFSGGNDPDVEQEQQTINDHLNEEPPEPYDELEETSGEEIAAWLSNMSHRDRMDYLQDDRLIHHHSRTHRRRNPCPTTRG